MGDRIMDISYYKQYEPIDGKWHITKELGRGAFGVVYEVERHDYSDMKSAMKIISIPANKASYDSFRSENYSMDDESVRNYFASIANEYVKEFQLMSKLKGNSNIVSYEDHDVKDRKDYIGWDIFIRMELLKPISEYFQNHYTQEHVIKLGIDICRALEVCQKYNIIHRDIKPTNIFVSETGDFKLGDFGVARILEKTSSHLSTKGTYTYMAPEVCRGDKYTAVADIYSLGIVMYKLLNDNLEPFRLTNDYGSAQKALELRLQGNKISAPKNADARVSEVILKACEFDPENRYQTPMQMRKKLESLLDGTYVTESYKKSFQPESSTSSQYIRTTGEFQAPPQVPMQPREQFSHQNTSADFINRTPVNNSASYSSPGRVPVAPVIPKTPPVYYAEPKPKTKSKKPLIALIIVLSVVLCFIGGIGGTFYYFDSSYSDAQKKLRNDDFDGARAIFNEIKWYKDSKDMILKCDYNEAEYLLEEDEYDKALAIFEELKNLGYMDSEERYNQCLLDKAEYLLTKDDPDGALDILSKLSENADADLKKRINECKNDVALSLYNDKNFEDAKLLYTELDDDNMVMECDYNIALSYKQSGDYVKAMVIFNSLVNDDFDDSQYQFERCVELLENENSSNHFFESYMNMVGKFSNGDGFYVEYIKKDDTNYQASYNLPHTKGTYFNVVNGVHYNGSDGAGWEKQWVFEKVSGNNYIIYDFVDGKTYEVTFK